MTDTLRRVVTGLDSEGRSTFLFDDRIPLHATRLLWLTEGIPVDNSGSADTAARDFGFDLFKSKGSTFMLAVFQPGDTADGPMMHATDTIDYIVVLRGRLRLTLDSGAVEFGAGDVIVDRGVMHGWEVIGDEAVVMVTVLIPAHPVGAGATV